jgi:hypothetical protein
MALLVMCGPNADFTSSLNIGFARVKSELRDPERSERQDKDVASYLCKYYEVLVLVDDIKSEVGYAIDKQLIR